jgi:hypothetical protein
MSEPIIEYRDEFNVTDFASKYAERISRVIDEQTLANVEHQLAMYGYVKVVRCRDCVHYKPYRTYQHGMMNRCHDEHGHTHKRDETDFCSRGEKASNFTTCKCGEDIETNGRESVTCPSCGRVITE